MRLATGKPSLRQGIRSSHPPSPTRKKLQRKTGRQRAFHSALATVEVVDRKIEEREGFDSPLRGADFALRLTLRDDRIAGIVVMPRGRAVEES
jgi:hypothetical protein